MSTSIAGLLLVTMGATLLTIWVLLPSNKAHFEQAAKLAMDDYEPIEDIERE